MSNVAYKVDEDVAPPPPRQSYPFGLLVRMGQSVYIPTDNQKAARSAAQAYAVRHGIVFAVTVEGNGVRVFHRGPRR